MFHTLGHSLSEFLTTLKVSSLTTKEVFHLFGFHEYLPAEFLIELKQHFPDEWQIFIEATGREHIGSEELQELLNDENGILSVFALLHTDRKRPGKLLIRKADGLFLTNEKGHLWSIPVLGLSGRELAFNHSNGDTPTGIMKIDSVMPEANNQYEFGKHRRLILNFIPKSAGEGELKKHMPFSHYDLDWWKPVIVARDMGRSLLRIHGTGRTNLDPLKPYFPMVPTSGCLATNESRLMGLFPNDDQRSLLDALMIASDLHPTFENESKIHGLLYVVEFDGRFQALEFRH